MCREKAKALIIGALLALCLTGTIVADTTSFKIQDFIPQRFEDFQWKLDGSLFSGGEYYDRKYTYDPDVDYFSNYSSGDYSAGYFKGATGIVYQYRSVPHFLTLSSDLGFSFNVTEGKYGSESRPEEDGFDESVSEGKSETASIEATHTLSADAGKYVWHDFFMSMILSARLNYRNVFDNSSEWERVSNRLIGDTIYYYNRNSVESDADENSRNNSVSGELAPGWGRIYEGWYASTAMYIIEELRSHQLLLREPSKDEMMVLCDIVYRNRLKHAVDSRIRRIETFDEILNYLEKSGLISDAGHYSYLLLQDVWDYFPRTSRSFGTTVRIGVGGSYTFTSSHETRRYSSVTEEEALYWLDDYTYTILYDSLFKTVEESYDYDKSWSRDIYLIAKLQYSKPISRRWQLDGGSTFKYYFDSKDRQAYYPEEYEEKYAVDVILSAVYFVSSRTQLNLAGSHTLRNYDANVEHTSRTHDSENREYSLTAFSGSLEYRLSIPTTLVVKMSQRWRDDDTDVLYRFSENYNHSYSFSVGISHYLY